MAVGYNPVGRTEYVLSAYPYAVLRTPYVWRTRIKGLVMPLFPFWQVVNFMSSFSLFLPWLPVFAAHEVAVIHVQGCRPGQTSKHVCLYSIQSTTEASVMQLNQPVFINFHINPAHGRDRQSGGLPPPGHISSVRNTTYKAVRSVLSSW